jgi:hypothetical protein
MTSMPDDARIEPVILKWDTQHGREKAEIGRWTRLGQLTPGCCVQKTGSDGRNILVCASGHVDAVHHAVACPNRSSN